MKNKKTANIEKVKPNANRNELRREFYEGIESQLWGLIETVRRFRIMLGMSQKEFAAYTGLTSRAVMEFEQGKRNPTVKTLEKMLKGSGLELAFRRRKDMGVSHPM